MGCCSKPKFFISFGLLICLFGIAVTSLTIQTFYFVMVGPFILMIGILLALVACIENKKINRSQRKNVDETSPNSSQFQPPNYPVMPNAPSYSPPSQSTYIPSQRNYPSVQGDYMPMERSCIPLQNMQPVYSQYPSSQSLQSGYPQINNTYPTSQSMQSDICPPQYEATSYPADPGQPPDYHPPPSYSEAIGSTAGSQGIQVADE